MSGAKVLHNSLDVKTGTTVNTTKNICQHCDTVHSVQRQPSWFTSDWLKIHMGKPSEHGVKCRNCGGTHWTYSKCLCPRKDTIIAEEKITIPDDKKDSTAFDDKDAVKCGNCDGQHLTSKCPRKSTNIVEVNVSVSDDKKSTTAIDDKDAAKCGNCDGQHLTSECPRKSIIIAEVNVSVSDDMKSTTAFVDEDRKICSTVFDHTVKCDGEYLTSKCPRKDTIIVEEKVQVADDEKSISAFDDKDADKCVKCSSDNSTLKYSESNTVMTAGKVPDKKKEITATAIQDSTKPNTCEGGKRTDSSCAQRRRLNRHSTAISISNLSNSPVDHDLEELLKHFGPVQKQKFYLAKDNTTGLCKGSAYVQFKFRDDAHNAIQSLNGHAYKDLILGVDWSKPALPN